MNVHNAAALQEQPLQQQDEEGEQQQQQQQRAQSVSADTTRTLSRSWRSQYGALPSYSSSSSSSSASSSLSSSSLRTSTVLSSSSSSCVDCTRAMAAATLSTMLPSYGAPQRQGPHSCCCCCCCRCCYCRRSCAALCDKDAARNNNNCSNHRRRHACPCPRRARRARRRYVCPLMACFAGVIGAALPCLYRVHCAVGRGAYATVWLLVCNRTGVRVIGKLTRAAGAVAAVDTRRCRQQAKSSSSSSSSSSNSDRNSNSSHEQQQRVVVTAVNALTEAAHQRTCHGHPNVLRLLHTYQRNDAVLHVLEYADAGDLYMQLVARRRRCDAQAPLPAVVTAMTSTSTNAAATTTTAAQSWAATRHVLQRQRLQRQKAAAAVTATTAAAVTVTPLSPHDDTDMLTYTNGNHASPGAHDAHFREDEVLLLFTQLCMAVHHLHAQRILHHDLKASNVMLTRAGLVKLGDFGFAQRYDSDVYASNVATTACGTPAYMAPEVWRRHAYNARAEVWSLGIILSEMLSLTGAVLRATVPPPAAATMSRHGRSRRATQHVTHAAQQPQQRNGGVASQQQQQHAHATTTATSGARASHTQRSIAAHADLMLLRLIALRKRCVSRVPAERYSAALVTLLKQMLSMEAAVRPTIDEVLCSPLLQQHALPLLCANVPRLRGVPAEVRDALVAVARRHASATIAQT